MKVETSAELAERILNWLERYATTSDPAYGPGDDALFLLLATLKGDLQYVSNLTKPSCMEPARPRLAVSV